MKGQTEIITPEYAKQLLEQNPKNRRVTQAIVERYALDMKEGRWHEGNGQTIVISRNGDLMDGQHRLQAVIRANIPVSFFVMRNVDPDAFVTIDTGKPRALNDLLSIQGYSHTREMAGAARLAWDYVAGVGLTYAPNRTILAEFVDEHPYLQDIAGKVANHHGTFPKVPLTAVLFLANSDGSMDAEVDSFLQGVSTGQGMWKGDPRLTLREWMIYHKTRAIGRTDMKTETMFAAAARCWNAHATAGSLTILKGLTSPTRANIKVVGFEPNLFSDVPDLKARWQEAQRQNLRRSPLIQAQKPEELEATK